ncbi:LysE family transporter [Pseudoalteromonas sp. TB64]|uniref:LysE family transporter n=1 Tax=Pseudoalteromonas sp. TB64 TaxID=1938600 RepID=UPI000425A57A|nr:LysE family transporter [Pseudoalteromonas sp. TB64]
MLGEYIPTISLVISISVVMVVSPGQDFAVITRNSLLYSRKSGVIGAFGIFCAIWLHVAYSLAGIAIIISQTEVLYNLIKYGGASYLIFLGIKCFFAKSDRAIPTGKFDKVCISNTAAFRAGFISNALNPKTTLFFLSIFTQVVTPETPYLIQLLFGFIIATAHFLWFSIVAFLFSSQRLANKIYDKKLWIERVMGGCLCLFAGKLIYF